MTGRLRRSSTRKLSEWLETEGMVMVEAVEVTEELEVSLWEVVEVMEAVEVTTTHSTTEEEEDTVAVKEEVTEEDKEEDLVEEWEEAETGTDSVEVMLLLSGEVLIKAGGRN